MTVECASGLLEKVWCSPQATYDTFEAFVAADATPAVKGSFKLEPYENFEKHNEALGTASLQGETELDRGGKWSGQWYIKPQAAGTPPDIKDILTAAMGSYTNTPATSDAFALSDAIAAATSSLQFMHAIDGHWSQFASGAWVEQMVITIPGNGLPTIEFSGGFARFGWVYRDDTAGAEAAAQTEIGIDDGSRGCVREPAMVEFTGDDNAAAGYLVTGTDNTAGSAHFDVSPGLAIGCGAGDEILPFVLAQTAAGTVLSATDCALTFGAVAPGFIEAKITLETGLGPRDKEATSAYPVGICRIADRVVESELSMYFTDTAAGLSPLMGFAHDGTTYDVDLRVGSDIAGKRMKINLPKSRLDILQSDLSEIVTVSGKLVSRQSAAAADEMDLLFD